MTTDRTKEIAEYIQELVDVRGWHFDEMVNDFEANVNDEYATFTIRIYGRTNEGLL